MRSAQCTKCATANAQLISDAGRLCARCLQSSIRGKLNKAIKVHFALEHGDVALVAVSGGACSMALANMLRSFYLSDWSRPQAGKVACNLHVVYIDERAASRKPAPHADEYYHRMRIVVKSLEPHYHTVRVCCLEDAFGEHRSRDARLQALHDKLALSKDDSSRQEVVRALRQQILLSQAKQLKCNKLLVGDSSTGLAARFIAMAAQGRGYASTAEVAMVDAREAGCCVVRPMLAVPRKELVLHCYFHDIPFLCDSVPASIKASVSNQTEEFVSDLYVRSWSWPRPLQESRRNTVANITKLATKLRGFPFNDIAHAPDPPLRDMVHGTDRFKKRVVPQTPIRQAEISSVSGAATTPIEEVTLCRVCRSPVPQRSEEVGSRCDVCDSCLRWILIDELEDDDKCTAIGRDTVLGPSHDRRATEF